MFNSLELCSAERQRAWIPCKGGSPRACRPEPSRAEAIPAGQKDRAVRRTGRNAASSRQAPTSEPGPPRRKTGERVRSKRRAEALGQQTRSKPGSRRLRPLSHDTQVGAGEAAGSEAKLNTPRLADAGELSPHRHGTPVTPQGIALPCQAQLQPLPEHSPNDVCVVPSLRPAVGEGPGPSALTPWC